MSDLPSEKELRRLREKFSKVVNKILEHHVLN